MFKNSYQSGLLSIFYSCGSHPLALWDMEVNNGHIKRITDPEVNSIVLEIVSTNVATTYIKCPPNNQQLGIKLPFLVMIVKNLKRYFSFEITILDDKNMRRRFRISNFQSTTKIKPFCTTMPIGLSGGWNQIQFNLSDFTKRAYGSQFLETLQVQVHANVRLRRIYFAERLYAEDELPQEYKLYLPLEGKGKKKAAKPADTAAKPEEAPQAGAESAPDAAKPGDQPPGPVTSKKSLETKKSTEGKLASKSMTAAQKKSAAALTPQPEEESAPAPAEENVEQEAVEEKPEEEPAENAPEETKNEEEVVEAGTEEPVETPGEEPPAAETEEVAEVAAPAEE